MKIPSERIDLGAIGYPDYWVEMPKSVREGFIHEFSKLGAGTDDDDSPEALDRSRLTNAKLLELVTAWNIDDEAGKVLPVMGKVKDRAARDKIVAEIPVDVLVFLAKRMTGNLTVPEATKDF